MKKENLPTAGALFSDCEKYRYRLWRIWDKNKPTILFIMLNPSTADAHHDDPTIRRCIGFAKMWGYGGMMAGNLFAYRSTKSKALQLTTDPEGIENNAHLLAMQKDCALTVCAWGDSKPYTPRNPILSTSGAELYCLGLTKEGNPRHPLYLSKATIPVPFVINQK